MGLTLRDLVVIKWKFILLGVVDGGFLSMGIHGFKQSLEGS